MQSTHRIPVAARRIAGLLLLAAGTCLPDAAAALKGRSVYSAQNGTGLPGFLLRWEAGPASGDVDADTAYDHMGDAYDAFKAFWNRDSYNGTGHPIEITVHYATGYCNSFWDGARFVFGDGNPAFGCSSLARSRDAVTHEWAGALIDSESGLIYSGESGGLHQGLSDIFSAFMDAWVAGGRTGTLVPTAATWLIGEDVVAPALRYMSDPAADGVSRDYWSSGIGNVDVHYSAGVANLAFYLLSQGGVHPRGRSTVAVTGIGMEKAIRLFYDINANHLLPSSNFAAARSACLQAATNLGFTAAERESVQNAWAAVGVGSPAGSMPPPDVDVVLANGVPVPGLGGTQSEQRFFRLDVPAGLSSLVFTIQGGTGDADLYVQLGSRPTRSTFRCRPYLNGSTETCTITAPAAGVWYVMIDAYTTYSGVTLRGTYAAPSGGDPYLVNGTAITGLSGATSSLRYWRIAAVAGRPLTIRISGGTGDADLYVRSGSRPTTSTYYCRPYLPANNETCTVSSPSTGDYYIMIRGYSAYSGVTLVGTY